MRNTLFCRTAAAAGLVLLLSGCGLFGGDRVDPTPTPTATQSAVAKDDNGVPLPQEQVPFAPRHVQELHEDPETAILQALGCFYNWDATVQEADRDAYLACDEIATDTLLEEVEVSSMIAPPTPYEADWMSFRERGLRAAAITVELTTSGHSHGEDPNEPDEQVQHEPDMSESLTEYREARVSLELSSGDMLEEKLDFDVLVIIERQTTEDPWQVDLVGHLDDSGYEWEPQ